MTQAGKNAARLLAAFVLGELVGVILTTIAVTIYVARLMEAK